MTAVMVSRALLKFVDDELLRAPMLFDKVIDGAAERASSTRPSHTAPQRKAAQELVQMLQLRRAKMSEYFMHSLREQTSAELSQRAPAPLAAGKRELRPSSLPLALVDEAEVATDVEVAHTIEAIKSTAEYEARELQSYTAAMVGDMDLTRNNNPFRAETFARALWAAAQVLPLAQGRQAAFMRHAAQPLAQVLRKAYAASSSRLDSQGVVPAAYRTLVQPGRRPDLPAQALPGGGANGLYGTIAALKATDPGRPVAPTSARPAAATQATDGLEVTELTHAVDAAHSPGVRQSQDLVNRLFSAIANDTALPADMQALIGRLHGPALALAVSDAERTTEDSHPLWHFVNRLAFEAEMTPDPSDPERRRLVRLANATIQQLTSEPEQKQSLYGWALERLDLYLAQRLARRRAALFERINALQELEDKLLGGRNAPTTLHGTLDVPQMLTVPAELFPESSGPINHTPGDESWLVTLRAGDWLRMFLQGRWVHVQLLWTGEREDIWLFCDGGSDATWAVRRRALVKLKDSRLLKNLKRRSLVRRAARQGHEAALPAPR